MPADDTAALAPLLAGGAHRSAVLNVSAESLLDELAEAATLCTARGGREDHEARQERRRAWRGNGTRAIHFDSIPPALRLELEPQASLYASDFDAREALQYVWLSSPGVRTHTHFDNDRNVFVQLLGRKRFVLWPPNQTARLCPYPRLHPLWHKSRVDFEAPDVGACASYAASEALVAEVGPGDLLYLPPFWWHTVETVTPSLSLSTLSRWPQLYNHMNAIYTHEYLFDALADADARAFALRAFLAKLLHVAGWPTLMADLLRRRGTPTCRECLSRTDFDVTLVWQEHLLRLPDDVRTVVLPELVEELTAQALGASEVVHFWRTCFGPEAPRFFLTKPGSEEHVRLWRQL